MQLFTLRYIEFLEVLERQLHMPVKKITCRKLLCV